MKLPQLMIALLLLGLVSNRCWAADSKVSVPATAAAASKSKASSKTKQPDAKETAASEARGNDQLTLDATVVTGNRELPKVMYIVPWKKADLSNLPGQPFNTLIDETLAPVDREVFRREVDYYQVIADKDRAGADQAVGKATPTADKK